MKAFSFFSSYQLEKLLSREAIITLSDSYISNLLINSASPDLEIPVDALIHHPKLLAGAVTPEMVIEVNYHQVEHFMISQDSKISQTSDFMLNVFTSESSYIFYW